MGVHKWGSRIFGDFFEFLLVFRLRDLQSQIRREKTMPKNRVFVNIRALGPPFVAFFCFCFRPKTPVYGPPLAAS